MIFFEHLAGWRGDFYLGLRSALALASQRKVKDLEASPILNGGLQRAIQQAGVEKMALELHDAADDRAHRMLPGTQWRLSQAQGKALRRAA